MLQTLKQLFDALTPPPQAGDGEHTLQLAAAVLLVEVMRSDAEITPAERDAVRQALQKKFALTADEGERLVELAHATARGASDTFAFTSRINEAFDMAQKIRMIECMWEVAYADGTLSAHENHLMRKVADLLYIPHGAYVNAKMRAKGATP